MAPDIEPPTAAEVTPPELAAFATALAGQYTLEREIGRGGMGVVYLGRDLKLDRHVALKTLPAHLAGDAMVRDRFLREARTAGALSHPNIVPIHRADELSGHVFFVMGYVDGDSLAQRVRATGPLATGEAMGVLRDVALALGYAHANHVVHRDVKAENILLDRRSGRALVTDFGIARLVEAQPLTATGHVLGSVHYMSPEQVAGERVDGRSDIYSLGVVGFYALSGQFPFDSDTASAILVAHITKPTPSLRDVAPHLPSSVVAIIDRCLAKSADDRFPTAGELAQALDDARARLDPHEIVPAASAAAARVISETEAHAIWQRASELQVATSGHAPPPVSRNAPPPRAASLSTGYRVTDVRSAALEAGIAPEHVEKVLVERGLATAPKDDRRKFSPSVRPPRILPAEPRRAERRVEEPSDGTPERPLNAARHADAAAALAQARGVTSLLVREDRDRGVNPFLGTSSRISFEATVDGEMPVRDFDLLVDTIQRRIGEVGQVSAVGRSLSWSVANQKRKVHLSIVPRHGRTVLHVEEDLSPAAGAWFGGIMGGGGGGGGSMLMGIVMATTHTPVLGFGAWLTTIGASYFIARAAFGRSTEGRRNQLRGLMERLTEQIVESIEAARQHPDDPPALPPPRP